MAICNMYSLVSVSPVIVMFLKCIHIVVSVGGLFSFYC